MGGEGFAPQGPGIRESTLSPPSSLTGSARARRKRPLSEPEPGVGGQEGCPVVARPRIVRMSGVSAIGNMFRGKSSSDWDRIELEVPDVIACDKL